MEVLALHDEEVVPIGEVGEALELFGVESAAEVLALFSPAISRLVASLKE